MAVLFGLLAILEEVEEAEDAEVLARLLGLPSRWALITANL